MTVAVLLLLASYLGFFIAPAAAPARVALAFLCFLMVLNNLHSVLASLPPLPQNNYRIWMFDFLIGTICFNWLALAEYAAVHAGKAAAQAEAAKKANATGTSTEGSKLEQISLHSRYWQLRARLQRWAAGLAHLDEIFRWLFVAAYAVFAIIMAAIQGAYETTTCSLEDACPVGFDCVALTSA